MKMRAPILAAAVFAASTLCAPAALSQENERAEIRAKRVTIEVDDQGNVLVDGKRVSSDDGAVLLRVEPEDGEVEVEAMDPRRRHMAVHRAPRSSRRHVLFRGDGDSHPFIEDFDFEFDVPHMGHLEPMMDRFRMEFGDPLRESMKEHREVAELERESRETARRLRQAESAERAGLEAELRDQLNEIFDKKLELREQRVENIEEKLAEERDKLERRRAAREEMIERRLRTLLGEDDILDW